MTTPTKMIMTNSPMSNNWWESEWYKKERRMIDEERKSQKTLPKIGRWICYYNENKELIYEYVNV